MTSRNGKAAITSKFGIKLGVSKSDTEIDKLRKENALLKKTMDEISKRKGKLTDMERNQLLETILKLETLKEKNTQQLAAKENEVITLRQQLKQNGDVVTLRAQLAEKNKEAERREQLFKSLAEETECVKNKYAAIAAKCQEFENQVVGNEVSSQNCKTEAKTSTEMVVIQEQLRDALDKNQQWLVYDQQREAYVKGLLSTIFELEQKLSQANQSLQQRHKEGNSEENNPDKKQEYYDKVLLTAKQDLEAQKTTVSQLQHELSELRKKYDQQSREVKDLNLQLHSERINSRQYVDDEKKRMGDKVQRLKEELENAKVRFEEERKRSSELSKRSSDLSSQVNLLQKSLLSQQEEQTRIAVLEQQEVKICTLMWPSEIGEIVWDIAFTGLDFVIPGLIIVTSYTKILQITKSSRRRLQSRRNIPNTETQPCQVSRQDFKLFRTLFLLMISFFVMWSPIFITVFLILIRNFKNGLAISSSLFFWVVTFTFANSALNPILYSISHFRHQWRHRLCCFSLLAPCKSTDIAIPLQTIQNPQAQLSLISV